MPKSSPEKYKKKFGTGSPLDAAKKRIKERKGSDSPGGVAKNPFTGRTQSTTSRQDVRTTPQPKAPRTTPQGRLIQDGRITTPAQRGEPSLVERGIASESRFRDEPQPVQLAPTEQDPFLGPVQPTPGGTGEFFGPENIFGPRQQELAFPEFGSDAPANVLASGDATPLEKLGALSNVAPGPVGAFGRLATDTAAGVAARLGITKSFERLSNVGLNLINSQGQFMPKVSAAAAGKIEFGKQIVNTWVARNVVRHLRKIFANKSKLLLGIIGGELGLHATAGWGKGEARDTLAFQYGRAVEHNLDDIKLDIETTIEEMNNPDTIESIKQLEGYLNLATQLNYKKIANNYQNIITDRISEGAKSNFEIRQTERDEAIQEQIAARDARFDSGKGLSLREKVALQ